MRSDGTITIKNGKVVILQETSRGVAYCSQCGAAVSDYFVINEMVLVDSGVDRPYYARIQEIGNDDFGPFAVVLRSPQEIEKVSLANLRKVE